MVEVTTIHYCSVTDHAKNESYDVKQTTFKLFSEANAYQVENGILHVHKGTTKLASFKSWESVEIKPR